MRRAYFFERRQQQGAVLFIAMIALIVMTLGALSMMRSVDSASGIAGNIGFRQQGVAATDLAAEAAMNWLKAGHDLTQDSASAGYYATQSAQLLNDDPMTIDWSNSGIVASAGNQNGYSLQYVIHRICANAGAPTQGSCPDSGNTLTQEGVSDQQPGLAGSGSITPLYRITARAVGPRQSESITQIIAY